MRIKEGSGRINNGNNAALPAGTDKDILGVDRVLDTDVDIGADEYQP